MASKLVGGDEYDLIYSHIYIAICYRSLFRNLFPRDAAFYAIVAVPINRHAHMGAAFPPLVEIFTDVHINGMVERINALLTKVENFILVTTSDAAAVSVDLDNVWPKNRQGVVPVGEHLRWVCKSRETFVKLAIFALQITH